MALLKCSHLARDKWEPGFNCFLLLFPRRIIPSMLSSQGVKLLKEKLKAMRGNEARTPGRMLKALSISFAILFTTVIKMIADSLFYVNSAAIL